MSYFQLFEEFTSTGNESLDKIYQAIIKWAPTVGYVEIEDNRSSDRPENSWYFSKHYDGGSFWFTTPYGMWHLDCESKKTKGGQNSNYQETYNSNSEKKAWYIHFPVRSSSYNHRSNVKAGNFNSFKKIFEIAVLTNKVYDKALEFLSLFGDKDHQEVNLKVYLEKWRKVDWDLKTLNTSLRFKDGTMKYYNERKEWECLQYIPDSNVHRTAKALIDINTGELYAHTFRMSGIDDEAIQTILDMLADRPIDEVWALIKDNNWQDLQKKYVVDISMKNLGF